MLEGSTFVGSENCQIEAKLGVFILGYTIARTHSTEKPQPKRQAQRKLNLLQKYFAFLPFWFFFVLSNRAVVSLGAKFNNRGSPRDKTLHVKGGYLLPLIEG